MHGDGQCAGRPVITDDKSGCELVLVPGGSFLMGSPETDKRRHPSERPQHEVTVGDFYIGRHPVTNEEYGKYLADRSDARAPQFLSEAEWGDARRPIVGVTWAEARAFAEWMGGRLPTEAEWEYACRAGTSSAFNDGSSCTDPDGMDPALDRLGWSRTNSGGITHPVCEKAPNAWGIYDMHGNVWEWCEDTWHRNYEAAPCDGRAWVSEDDEGSAFRILRGGCWGVDARSCVSTYRYAYRPEVWTDPVGFRVARPCSP